ncbi:MAG TPA: cell division protein FtsZ [bacterium]|nr:cell division protein FtsZ [bacterium]
MVEEFEYKSGIELIEEEFEMNGEVTPRILIIGVGGAGCNVLDSMYSVGLDNVSFLAVNTDMQSLGRTVCPDRLHIGRGVTDGLGTGGNPLLGERSAKEDRERLSESLKGHDLVFLIAGLGGGTGTGATPVIAEIAHEQNSLTVAIVTKPFEFEGPVRRRNAERGREEIRRRVDTLITMPNDRLVRMVDEKTTFTEALGEANRMLYDCVEGLTQLTTEWGIVNLDFEDVRATMANNGGALMGIGQGQGEDKMHCALEEAMNNLSLDETHLDGLNNALINVTAGPDLTIHEVNTAIGELVQKHGGHDANIRFGLVIKEAMQGRVRVTLLATGHSEVVQEMPVAPADSFTTRMSRTMETLEVPKRRVLGISFLDRAESNKGELFFKQDETEEELLKVSGNNR